MKDTVKELAAAMRDVGATHARWSDGKVTLELVLGPEPVAPDGDLVPRAKAFGEDEEPRCVCGHGKVTEHNDAGCLAGCSSDLCAREPGAEPEEE